MMRLFSARVLGPKLVSGSSVRILVSPQRRYASFRDKRTRAAHLLGYILLLRQAVLQP
jgi:hypothetical protein